MSLSDRSARLLAWIVPPLFCLALYWPGLLAWFQKDDFAWLGARWGIQSWHDLAWTLFAFHTEGTFRPWSHGAFFMSISAIFGVYALPFRIVAFLTQFANATLLNVIASKLTGSRAAGFWGAILWIANGSLATPMSWTCAYNVILGAFFILLAFWLFLRYVESGDRRYYAAQFAVFVLGFGALETNLVYPVLVGTYVLCSNRKYLGKVVPLVLVSMAYTVWHLWMTPTATSGPYRAYFDSSIFSTLWNYWKVALGPNRLILLGIWPLRWRSLLAVILMVALFCFLIQRLRKRDWAVALGLVWFVTSLVPVLPLRDHFDPMYLTIPTIGLAIWGAWAVVCGWRSSWFYKAAAAVVVCIYLAVSLPVARVGSRAISNDSVMVKAVVLGIVNAARKDDGSLVLLSGVDDDMYHGLYYYRPFGAYGMWDVYLTPESRVNIHTPIDPDSLANFFPSEQRIRQAAMDGRLQVLDVSGESPRDVTVEYERSHPYTD